MSHMERLLNTYTDEFRRNVVAVIRSGMKACKVADRLNISRYTIYDWLKNPKFADVQPASEEVLAALPAPQVNEETKLVPITKTERKVSLAGEIKLKVGKMEMILPQDFGKESLVTIIKALGEAGVL